jgi:hypothetical protein
MVNIRNREGQIIVRSRSKSIQKSIEENVHGLSGADLSHKSLSGYDLSYADLRSAKFTCSNLRRVNFSCADLAHVDFMSASLTGANFSDSTINGADFTDATVDLAQLIYGPEWYDGDTVDGKMSDDLTLQLMRLDCQALPDGNKLFKIWLEIGECPFRGNIVRPIMFPEDRKLWKPGRPQSLVSIWKMIQREFNIRGPF